MLQDLEIERLFAELALPESGRQLDGIRQHEVRRHQRLPKTLVVDGAKEFRSRELEKFCRLYEIDLRHRPSGMPRGKSLDERAIGASVTEVIAKLKGNTRIMKRKLRHPS